MPEAGGISVSTTCTGCRNGPVVLKEPFVSHAGPAMLKGETSHVLSQAKLRWGVRSVDELRWGVIRRTMKKSRERVREEDAERGLRKTRDRLREPRARRPRTRDSGVVASPVRDVPSPIPSTAYGAADTAGTWVGTCSPSPARRDGEFGFHGFVEQQRQLASEMQRQVAELKSQRDQARQEALKVKEDAMNDRAKHLQELQQVLAEQLRRDEEPKVEVLKDAEEAFERSIISDSRFVAIDAALTALLSPVPRAHSEGHERRSYRPGSGGRRASLQAERRWLPRMATHRTAGQGKGGGLQKSLGHGGRPPLGVETRPLCPVGGIDAS
ncbi:unnamed protein product [Cladocopium goreaui]|uniref:Ankyrin-2 n=1 Tax=Cladocopium goreaui TaxID=2562237 RepID=A0A9P1C5I4_9DINO|nr:unnamed protein product [Cladocopium goreaui]